MWRVEEFFDLTLFSHSLLWKAEDPVWAPLFLLMGYLQLLPHRIEIEIPPSVFLQNPETISIGKGTILEPGVLIKGPCILGKDCHIHHGAYLREGTLCGDRCVIGHSAEIKHSILLNEARATHFTYVGDSILGEGVNLGAGVKCANLRLDKKEIAIAFNGMRVKTGLRKMGAVVGDGAQIGCNSVLNPGTLVKKGVFLPPLTSGKGVMDGHRATSKTH